MINGRSVPSQEDGFPVLRLTALKNDRVDLRERKAGAWTSKEAAPFLVTKGDFLVSRGNGSLNLVGRGALLDTEPDPVAFPDTVIRIRANDDMVLPRFLALQWNSRHVRSQIEGHARTTAGIYKVNQSILGQINLVIPPVEEQQWIVEILEDHISRLDAAERLASQAQRRLVSLRRSTLKAVVNRRDRATMPLRRFIERIEAGKSFGGAAAPAIEEQWGIIKVSAMTWGEFRPEENKTVPASAVNPRHVIRSGDLLVSRANTADYVGASVLVGDVRPRLLLSDKSLRLVLRDGVDSRWLWLALSSPDVRKQISAKATGTKDSMRNISQSALLSVEIPNVPLAQQQADVAQMTTYFGAMTELSGSLDVAQRRQWALRRSLLDAAFSGRLTGRASEMDRVEEMAGV